MLARVHLHAPVTISDNDSLKLWATRVQRSHMLAKTTKIPPTRSGPRSARASPHVEYTVTAAVPWDSGAPPMRHSHGDASDRC